MRVNKKRSDELQPERSMEMVQANHTTGYETCQPIEAIKEELDRLKIEMDKYNHLEKEYWGSIANVYSDKANRAAIRYWAIRWVMGWEKEEDIK